MLIKTLFALSLLTLVPMLGACKGDDNEEASRSVIDGLWETACVTAPDQTSHKIRLNFFFNNTVDRLETYFADAACVIPRGRLGHVGGYDLTVRNEISLYEIDMFFTEATAIPSDSDGAAAWNAQHFCGLTRWLAGVDEKVISQTDPACGVFGVSRIEYRDLVQVDPKKTLIFGSQLQAGVTRPTSIDSSNPANVFYWINP